MRRSSITLLISVVVGLACFAPMPATAACHNAVFVGDPYSRSEGGGQVTITVSNQAGQPPGGTVDYRTVEGTAKAGSDYTTRSGTLTFAAGEEEKSFNVPIASDSSDEPNETFTVELSNPTGCFATGNLDSPATVTIQDDDNPAPQPTPTPTQRSTPRRTPTPTPTQAATPTPTPTPSPTLTTPTPSPSVTPTQVAIGDSDDDGIPTGAVAGIIAGVVALGGAGAFFVRRWMRGPA